ncbi:hypothetical protein HPB47_003588, partial [Ixodes persulcatus]
MVPKELLRVKEEELKIVKGMLRKSEATCRRLTLALLDKIGSQPLGDLMTNYLTDCGRRVRKRLEMLAAKEATTKKRRTAATAVENLAHSSASSPNVPQAAPPTATIDSPASLAPAVTPPLEEPESTDGTSEPKQLRGVENRRPGKFKSMCTNAAITTLHSITGTMLVQLDTGGTYAEAAARGAAPPLKATVGTQYSLRDLECSPSPPTTSEASVGSQTPAGLPKVPRAKTVPHRPGPKPRVVLDATPTQSSEGPTPSTSQREEEAMEVSADPTEPPPPAKGGMTDRAFENKFADYDGSSDVILPDGKFTHKFEQDVRKHVLELVGVLEKNLDKHTDWNDASVYTGTTGVALMYMNLAERLGDPGYLKRALPLVERQLKGLRERRFSFLCGDAGPLAVGAVLYHLLSREEDSRKLVKKLLDLSKHVAPLEADIPDELLYGRVGYLSALLFVRKHIATAVVSSEVIRD